MAYFEVNPSKLENTASSIQRNSKKLVALQQDLKAAKSKVSLCNLNTGMNSVIRRLNACIEDVQTYTDNCSEMSSVITNIRTLYVNTESSLVPNKGAADIPSATAPKPTPQTDSDTPVSNTPTSTNRNWGKTIFGGTVGVIKDAAGFVGSMFSFTKNLGKGDFAGVADDAYSMINVPFKVGQKLVGLTMYGFGGIAAMIPGGTKFADEFYKYGDDYMQRDGLSSEVKGSPLEKPVKALDTASKVYDIYDDVTDLGKNIDSLDSLLSNPHLSDTTKLGGTSNILLDMVGFKDFTGASGSDLYAKHAKNIKSLSKLVLGVLK